jgi:hypothetical protein
VEEIAPSQAIAEFDRFIGVQAEHMAALLKK